MDSPKKSKFEPFDCLRMADPDPILDTVRAFLQDPDKNKVNLAIGAYRTPEGKPKVMDAVREAEERIIGDKSLFKEYLPNEGDAQFISCAQKFLLGDESLALKENRVSSIQTPSGSCALRVGANFIRKYLPRDTVVCISNPGFGNHYITFEELRQEYYPYCTKDQSLDLTSIMHSFDTVAKGSILLLQTSGHNPTGIDPTKEEWSKIAQICIDRELIPFFDCAYQGFVSGDLEIDAYPIRLFLDMGLSMFIAQSFSKNFGIYGERVGCFHIVSSTPTVAAKALSCLKQIARIMYAAPPIHGARLVKGILLDAELKEKWLHELMQMAAQMKDRRKALYAAITKNGTPGDWSYIVRHKGMFSFTPISGKLVKDLMNDHHVYICENGRLSLAGITETNAQKVADAIHAVMTKK